MICGKEMWLDGWITSRTKFRSAVLAVPRVVGLKKEGVEEVEEKGFFLILMDTKSLRV